MRTFTTECSGEFRTGAARAGERPAASCRGLIGNPVRIRSDPVTVKASLPPYMSLRSGKRCLDNRPPAVGRRRKMLTLSQETCSHVNVDSNSCGERGEAMGNRLSDSIVVGAACLYVHSGITGCFFCFLRAGRKQTGRRTYDGYF